MKWNDALWYGNFISLCLRYTRQTMAFRTPIVCTVNTKNEPCAPTRNDKMRLKNDRPKVHVDLSEVEQINGNVAWGL